MDGFEELTNIPLFTKCQDEILIPYPDQTLRDGKEIKTWMGGWESGFKEAKEELFTLEQLKSALILCDETHKSVDEILKEIQTKKWYVYFDGDILKEHKRYFVDIRSGCGAVRDNQHPTFDPSYPGLHFDTSDVVFYKHGYQDRQDNCWKMKEEDIEFLNKECVRLNQV